GGASSVSSRQSVSADGRYIVFSSAAPNLVPGDTSGVYEIFVRDTQTGAISLVSTGAGLTARGDAELPVISGDGRYVAFRKYDTPEHPRGNGEVYVKDLQTGAITLASSGPTGRADGDALSLSLSEDGRFLAFSDSASNLISGVSGVQIYVKDLKNGVITLASSGPSGPSNNGDYDPVISADGRFVAFSSFASNLVALARNNARNSSCLTPERVWQTIDASCGWSSTTETGEHRGGYTPARRR